MRKIAVGIVGVGNCASGLLQAVEFYRAADPAANGHTIGLMHDDLCGYRRSDIEVVCAFDVDARKVGQSLDVAAKAPPNNARPLYPRLPRSSVVVQRGPVLDGISDHMRDYPPEEACLRAERRPAAVVDTRTHSGP